MARDIVKDVTRHNALLFAVPEESTGPDESEPNVPITTPRTPTEKPQTQKPIGT